MKFFKYLALFIISTIVIIYTILSITVNKEFVLELVKKEFGIIINFDTYSIKFLDGLGIYLKNASYKDKNINIDIEKIGLNFSFKDGYDLEKVKIKSILLKKPNINIQTTAQKTSSNSEVKTKLIDIEHIVLQDAKFSYNDFVLDQITAHLSISKEGVLDMKNFYIEKFKGLNKLSLKGNISELIKSPFLNLQVKVEESNLSDILQRFNISIEQNLLKKLTDKQLSFNFNIKGNESKLYIQDSKINLNKTEISFSTSLSNLDYKNSVLILNINEINLNDYLDLDHKTEDKKSENEITDNYQIFSQIKKLQEGIKFSTSVNINKLIYKNTVIENLFFKSLLHDNILTINPIKLDIFNGNMKGIYKIDLNKEKPRFDIKQVINNLQIEKLMKSEIITGKANLITKVTFTGLNKTDIVNSIDGIKLLKGENLKFHLYDIDTILDSYEETRKVSLIDIGAIALLGPLGGLLSQGVKFGILYDKATTKGTTDIKELVSLWVLKDRTASIKDVAVKTKNNLIAINGAINLSKMELIDVELGTVKNNGCPNFKQLLKGNISENSFSPDVNVMESFLAPIGNLIGDLNNCDTFYQGSLLK